jgi:group II intron reverse transcriptase/maturase
MSLQAPAKVQKLQTALHAKAKESPGYRFYALYDKVYREDILAHAYTLCRKNGGAPGVDGEDFGAIEASGLQRWLGELAESLRRKTYRPDPVKRVEIPKPGGKTRSLGIPTIRDRVAQTAAVLVLGPIFEADFPSEQYGYRAGRSGLDAVQAVHGHLMRGRREVVDADLKGYFDTIPHAELMKSLARRVVDRHMLHLVKMWLVAPVEERGGGGNGRRRTPGKDRKRGIPQGAPVSPLLANLYFRRFIVGWKQFGFEGRYEAHIVNYADDFVICAKRAGEEVLTAMRRLMECLKLTVNEEKTHRCRIPEETFDFLGYRFGICYRPKTGSRYIGTRPTGKSVRKAFARLSELTDRRTLLQDAETVVSRMNAVLRGWANYFCLGPVSNSYRALDAHAKYRLRRWLRRKHKKRTLGSKRWPDEFLYEELGLVRLPCFRRGFPCAPA